PSDLLETLRYQEIHLEVGRINDLLRQGGFQKLLVDLGKLTRLDGVVLTALVGFCRSLPTAAFCSASGDVRQSMQLASLVSLWPIYPNRATALAALSEPHPAADAPPT